MIRRSLLFALPALAACQTTPPPAPAPQATVEVTTQPGWRSAASAEDVARLDGVAMAWEEALRQARREGFTRQITAEGRLLEPSVALPRPAPSPGSWDCRVIRFGADRPGGRFFTAHRPFYCYVGVDEDDLFIAKQTGSQRPVGYLWEDGEASHLIFLGTLALGSEEDAGAYGDNPARDMAGIFERIGPLRFRLVVPRPRSGAVLEVIELTPAANQPEE